MGLKEKGKGKGRKSGTWRARPHRELLFRVKLRFEGVEFGLELFLCRVESSRLDGDQIINVDEMGLECGLELVFGLLQVLVTALHRRILVVQLALVVALEYFQVLHQLLGFLCWNE